MIRLFFRLIFFFLVLVPLLLIVGYLSMNRLFKKGIETAGPALAKVDVRVDRATVSPLSGNGQITRLFVGNPQGYQTPSAIEAETITLGLAPRSLISDPVRVHELRIVSPQITFEGSLSGNNLSQILENLKTSTTLPIPGRQQTPSDPATERRFYVRDLAIVGGQVKLSMTGLGGRSAGVTLPDIRLQNLGTEERGLTAAELSTEILRALLVQVTRVVTASVPGAEGIMERGRETIEQLDRATRDVRDLFRK